MNDDIFAAIDEHNDRAASEARIWNLFAQILIPLVILITFVAVDGIRRYGEYLQNEQVLREIAEKGRTQCEISQNRVCTTERNQSWALNQWQDLLLQLDAVMQQKRHELGLEKFRDAGDVHLEGVMIADQDFQNLSKAAADQLENASSGQRAYIKSIYQTVIERASLHDQTSPDLDTEVGLAAAHPMLGDPGDFDLSGGSVDSQVVIEQIRLRFLSRIAAECNGLRDAVMQLQIGTVGRIYQALQASPEQLSERDRYYAAQMLEQGIPADERAERAKAFYRKFNESLQGHLGAKDYVFLRETWDALNSY